MRRLRTHLTATCMLLGITVVPARAEVFWSEFFSSPLSEGWDLILRYCEPDTWTSQGWYYQQLNLDACPPGPGGGTDVYRRSLESLNGLSQFFLEFRVQADGDRSEIPWGAPTVVAMGNFFGVTYHITVARDLVQFFRDADLPIWFTEIEAGIPHIYRIELYPDQYAFYIDSELIDVGAPEGTFPAYDSRLTWQGSSWDLPCSNSWDYFRYGVTPAHASGDFDSDALLTLDDFYFFHECLTNERPGINGGPDEDAGPGCRWADFDADSDVDLLNFAEFQNRFGSQP